MNCVFIVEPSASSWGRIPVSGLGNGTWVVTVSLDFHHSFDIELNVPSNHIRNTRQAGEEEGVEQGERPEGCWDMEGI